MSTDYKTQNRVAWEYAERIRVVDAMCDAIQLGTPTFFHAAFLHALSDIGWGPGTALWVLERARLAELSDPEPER